MRLRYGPALKGWGFDMKRLRQCENWRGGGAFPLPTEGDTRKFDKPSNKPTTTTKEGIGEICHYSGLLSIEEYM